jgi:FAS-associated factor 2
MSQPEVDLDQLSDSEKSTLEMYMAVTSFKGVRAFPIKELGYGNLACGDQLNSRTLGQEPGKIEHLSQVTRATATDLAPRVDTQPGDHPIYRPPFIL